jgi:hypothetical protein
MARPKKKSDRHRHKTVSFRLPQPLVEQLRDLAVRNRRTLSGEAQLAFENHVARTSGDGEAKKPSDDASR